MNKVYSRINWKNYPSVDTAVNESNLNRMDYAIDEIDKRVVEYDTTKLDVETANSMVRNVSFNERSGIFTITYLNGSTKELDTKLEKIAVNFEYDADRQKLILTLIDGTYQEIDMAALITEYEFENSAYISWTVTDGKVKAEIIGGSITEDMLQPNFLADCRLYAGNAENSATLAGEYAEQAKESAESISNKASDISFDDTNAQLGADDVQGAIEGVKSDVDAVEEKTVYLGEGSTSYMAVDSSGTITKKYFLIDTSGNGEPLYNKKVLESHDDVLEALSPLQRQLGLSSTELQNLHVKYITTGANTKATIKFKTSSSFAFLFGRSSGNAPICASIAYSAVKNLAEQGTFSVSGGVVECTLGTYAMGLLLHNGNIESITYS